MYECDADYGPPEKYPDDSLQYAWLVMFRRFERERKGCEAVGESHEFIPESHPTEVILDANRKVIGDINALFDPRARFHAPGVRYTGRAICRHCRRIK